MLRGRGLLVACLVILSVASAGAAQREIVILKGKITPKNYFAFEQFVSGSLDRVIGLKVQVDKSPEGAKLSAEADKDGQFVIFMPRGGRTRAEIVANEGHRYEHGAYVFDGFFLVKSGGFFQGIRSYALEPVDEAKVRLSPVKLRQKSL
jgi:hypothetical protein